MLNRSVSCWQCTCTLCILCTVRTVCSSTFTALEVSIYTMWWVMCILHTASMCCTVHVKCMYMYMAHVKHVSCIVLHCLYMMVCHSCRLSLTVHLLPYRHGTSRLCAATRADVDSTRWKGFICGTMGDREATVPGTYSSDWQVDKTVSRVQSTGGGGGEASPPNTQASPPKVFPTAI